MSQPDKRSSIKKVLAGGLAGASETFVSYPAEFLKTRRQLPEARALSLTSIVRSTYSAKGIGGFYSGCGTLAISNACKSGVRFFSFEKIREELGRVSGAEPGHWSAWMNVCAGLGAGVVESLLVVTPGEVLKTRLVQEAAMGQAKGLADTAAHIVRHEGPGALWRGLGPVLCKQGTNSAVRFSTFAILQDKLYAKYPSAKGGIAGTLILGGLSGVVTVYASMPFDNVKTRIQSNSRHYDSMMDCAKTTLREEGISAFWRGTSPRLARLTVRPVSSFVRLQAHLRIAIECNHIHGIRPSDVIDAEYSSFSSISTAIS